MTNLAHAPEDAPQDQELPSKVAKLHAEPPSRIEDLLANQPRSLAGLSVDDRARIVVSAVVDEAGVEHVMSRYRNHTWRYPSSIDANNIPISAKALTFDRTLPQSLMQDVRAVARAPMELSRPNREQWGVRTTQSMLRSGHVTLREVVARGAGTFSDITPKMLSDIAGEWKETASAEAIGRRMQIIQLAWEFPQELIHPLRADPWSGKTFSRMRGFKGNDDDAPQWSGIVAKTPVIPPPVQRAMFELCEGILAEAKRRIAAGERSDDWGSFEIDLRDAVVYLVEITTGMRISETTGISSNCWRSEEKLGTTLHWIGTHLIKGGKRPTEFLAPPEAVEALKTLQVCIAPLQARLRDEAEWLRKLLSEDFEPVRPMRKRMESGLTKVQTIERLNHVKAIQDSLFLGLNNGCSDHRPGGVRVDVMTLTSSIKGMNRLLARTGFDWHIANHQCRRTFSFNVVNSRLGRFGLVFLKWQLKHASISWSQLYGANPHQDHVLYQELREAQIEALAGLMEGWMDVSVPLSGGAGKKIMQARATPVRNLRELLVKTAEVIEIASTGHGWCLCGTSGCHGQGVYDPNMCVPCSQAVMDPSTGETWQLIHLDNLRLASITDCGQAVKLRGQRAVEKSRQVLNDLHVPPPSPEMEAQYRVTTDMA